MASESLPRVITLGESMVLVTPSTAARLAEATDFRLDAAGAESNLASHLAHSGIHTAWVSALGSDALGDRLCTTLERRGVDTRWVTRNQRAPTGVYLKDPGHDVYYYRAGSAASKMSPQSLRGIPIESVELVHLSGITPALSVTCDAAVESVFERLAATDTVLSFDINYRRALWPCPEQAAEALRAYADRADLVFVGLDEANTLWGCVTPAEVRELIPGPQTVVIKDSDHGATEWNGQSEVFVPAIPTQVVEAVGAGDAFAAGYIAALLSGADAEARLQAGHERAHVVLQSTKDFVAAPDR